MDSADEIFHRLKTKMHPLPQKVYFYCSPLLKCVEEQYKALFLLLKNNVCAAVPFEFCYVFPQNIEHWNTDTETLYVLGMNLKELLSMLRISNNKLPKYYIWWQTEQFSNSRFFSDSTWMNTLGNSVWVWDYAQPNAEYLREKLTDTIVTVVPHSFCSSMIFHALDQKPNAPSPFFPLKEIPFMTITTAPRETIADMVPMQDKIRIQKAKAIQMHYEARLRQMEKQKNVAQSSRTFSPLDPEYDVLLLGSIAGNQRRDAVNILRNKYKLHVATPYRGKYYYGEEREQQIRKSKVCINVHFFRDPSVLETARLNLLLVNGSAVVSERSTAQNGIMDERYEKSGAVLFVPQGDIEELCRKCNELCKNDEMRSEQKKRAIAFSQREDQQVAFMARNIVAVFQKLFYLQ